MATDIDIKRNSRIRLTKDGYQAERVALVSGVSGTAAQVLFNAINDAGLPNIGDAHPEISTINLQEIECQPLGGGQYSIRMKYYKDSGSTTTQSAAEVRANTGLAVEETHLDINGEPMTAFYIRFDGQEFIRQRFTAEVERPRITFDFEYTATAYPTAAINKYLGKLNSVAWNGYAAETVLCSGINVDQNGDNFRIRYSFAYRAEGWQFRAKTTYTPPLFIDASEPDNQLDTESGTKLFTVYRAVDFTPLGFTFDSVDYVAVYDSGRFRITGAAATLTVA